jgi:hypothetical protein
VSCVGFDVDEYYLDIAKRLLTAWVEDDLSEQLPLAAVDPVSASE